MGKSGGIYQRLSGGKLLLGGGFWNTIISDRPFFRRKIQFEKHIQRGIPSQDGAGKDRFFYVRRVEIYPITGRNIYGLAFAMALHSRSRAFPVDVHRVGRHA